MIITVAIQLHEMLRVGMYTRTEKCLNSRCAYDDRISTCRRRFGCTADKLLLAECRTAPCKSYDLHGAVLHSASNNLSAVHPKRLLQVLILSSQAHLEFKHFSVLVYIPTRNISCNYIATVIIINLFKRNDFYRIVVSVIIFIITISQNCINYSGSVVKTKI